MQSKAPHTQAYLDELPAPRREAIARVRDLVRRHLPAGFREAMSFGMIVWEVPLERYPLTYNGKALMRAGLAAQKRYNALYLSCTYQDPHAEALLREAARREGKRLDMGGSCLRFRAPNDLPLDAVAALLRRLSVDDFVASHERARAVPAAAGRTAAKKTGAKKSAAKKSAAKKSANARAAGAKPPTGKAATKTAASGRANARGTNR